jgi:ADP-heptose:LPS heptosyltransferase
MTYAPEIFDQPDLKQAKAIILTPEAGLTTDERWELETKWLREKLEFSASPVLDYGCGVGRVSRMLIKHQGLLVVGCDISENMREMARAYVNDPAFAAFSPQMLSEMVTGGFRVSGAVAIWTLQHIPATGLAAAIDLIDRALDPGGVLWTLERTERYVPTNTTHGFIWDNDGVDVHALLARHFNLVSTLPAPDEICHPGANLCCWKKGTANERQAERTGTGRSADTGGTTGGSEVEAGPDDRDRRNHNDRGQGRTQRLKRFLLVRFGGIGDNLIASSVLPLLAEDYQVDVMAQSPQSCVFENNKHIAKLIVREPDSLPTGDAWHGYLNDRGKEYDKWINLSHTVETELALFRSQTAFWWPKEARRHKCHHSYLEYVHYICNVPADFRIGPRFYPTAEEVLKADETLAKVRKRGKVIGIPVSGSRLDKIWPYLPLLSAKLIQQLPVSILLFGASERDRLIAEHILDFVKLWVGNIDAIHCAIDTDPNNIRWPIRRALTTLQGCDLVLTPDTGLAWAAAMEAMPKVVLVSHASNENITKHWTNTVTLHADPERVDCWPCHRLHDEASTCRKAEDAEAAACMADIRHEVVFETIRDLLKTT